MSYHTKDRGQVSLLFDHIEADPGLFYIMIDDTISAHTPGR